MKTLKQYQDDLAKLTDSFGFNPGKVEQGSDEWFRMKLGVISASNIEKALAKEGTATRSGYMAELVAQICTGERPEINAKALAWGKEHEAAARSAYEFATGDSIDEIAFIYSADMRSGCSPDGLIKGKDKGLELKCPFSSRTFIEFLTDEKIKPEYIKQCQFAMWITGAEAWDFANYDPRMKKNMIHIVTIERDEKMMEEFDTKIPKFIKDMDAMLERAGFCFGEQWVTEKKAA